MSALFEKIQASRAGAFALSLTEASRETWLAHLLHENAPRLYDDLDGILDLVESMHEGNQAYVLDEIVPLVAITQRQWNRCAALGAKWTDPAAQRNLIILLKNHRP